MKAALRDFRSAFMKVFANFRKSRMDEKDNAEYDSEDEADEKEYNFSSNVFELCHGDM